MLVLPKAQVFFAYRRLPMGKNKNILCVLRVSVVKKILRLIRDRNYK